MSSEMEGAGLWSATVPRYDTYIQALMAIQRKKDQVASEGSFGVRGNYLLTRGPVTPVQTLLLCSLAARERSTIISHRAVLLLLYTSPKPFSITGSVAQLSWTFRYYNLALTLLITCCSAAKDSAYSSSSSARNIFAV